MKGVAGILLIGGGIFLIVALFNGTLHFPLGNVSFNVPNPFASGGFLGTSTPASLQQGINPQKTPINNASSPTGKSVCPTGLVLNPATNKCVNIYQGNR